MKQRIVYGACLAVLGVALSGCGRIVDWGKARFTQVESLPTDTKGPQAYVRSVTLYDQFATVAIFDALWLSDEVRTAYTDVYAMRYGKDEEQKKVFLRRQFAQNRHFITFYVLSTKIAPLSESEGDWTLFLQIGDESFAPQEIKKIELEPEYKAFFGKKFNRFKQAYRVTFDANDSEELPLLREETAKMTLFFRSVDQEVQLSWDVSKLALLLAEKPESKMNEPSK